MAPLSLVPLSIAKAVWFGVSVAFIATLVRWSSALWPGVTDRRLIALAILVVMGKFYLHELTLGQSNALMAVAVLLALKRIQDSRSAGAGLALATAVLVKPYALAFLPYLAFRRLWAACAWMAGGVAFLVMLPAIVYGPSRNQRLLADWVGTIVGSSRPNLLNQDNASMWSMYTKWIGPGDAALWIAGVTVAAMALALAWIVTAGEGINGRESLEVAAILLALPLASPQGWDYVLLIATPVVAVLVSTRSLMPAPIRTIATAAMLVMGLSLFDLMGRQAYAAFMGMGWISICALVLFATLAIVRRRRLA
jgi:hypothetical protein